MSNYKLSVITGIGSLNVYGKFIQRYFDNICSQEMFEQTEHIIVCKEEGPELDILKGYDNIKIYYEDTPSGVYGAWNTGIKLSTTPYITNWNIDDLRFPTNTKLKYEFLELNPRFSIAYNYYVSTNDINETFENITPPKPMIIFPDNYEEYCTTACLIGPDPMWRKNIHNKIGFFDQDNYPTIGDWEMWIRIAQAGYKFKLIPEILCLYLDHTNTVSNTSYHNNKLEEEKIKLAIQYKDFKTKPWSVQRIIL